MKNRERKVCNAHTLQPHSIQCNSTSNYLELHSHSTWTAHTTALANYHPTEYTRNIFKLVRERKGRKNCIFPIKHFPLISVLVIWDFCSVLRSRGQISLISWLILSLIHLNTHEAAECRAYCERKFTIEKSSSLYSRLSTHLQSKTWWTRSKAYNMCNFSVMWL